MGTDSTRSGKERREDNDRRKVKVTMNPDRRSGEERRSGKDRREED